MFTWANFILMIVDWSYSGMSQIQRFLSDNIAGHVIKRPCINDMRILIDDLAVAWKEGVKIVGLHKKLYD
jgi:hypothetical protein